MDLREMRASSTDRDPPLLETALDFLETSFEVLETPALLVVLVSCGIAAEPARPTNDGDREPAPDPSDARQERTTLGRQLALGTAPCEIRSGERAEMATDGEPHTLLGGRDQKPGADTCAGGFRRAPCLPRARSPPGQGRGGRACHRCRSPWRRARARLGASMPKTSRRIASRSRSESPRTQAEMTRVSRAFSLLTVALKRWLHRAEWAWRIFGRRSSTGPRGGLDRAQRLEAVAKPLRAVLAPALVALAAGLHDDELLDDGLVRPLRVCAKDLAPPSRAPRGPSLVARTRAQDRRHALRGARAPAVRPPEQGRRGS